MLYTQLLHAHARNNRLGAALSIGVIKALEIGRKCPNSALLEHPYTELFSNPLAQLEEPDEGCIRPSDDVFCFLAGDTRANEQTVSC